MLRPAIVPALFGGRADNAAARTEVRAVYGGLPLGIAASLAFRPRSSGTMASLSGAMAGGRAASLLLEEDQPSSMNLLLLGVESALAVASYWVPQARSSRYRVARPSASA